jgi:16S rRNA A1518/A1519 N6-dimethyltransferase RsmA/KsgA/DIM1 with predicted DNA glycosylase/AP lyase activity
VYPQLGTGAPLRFRDRFTSRIFEPAPEMLSALVEITFANELEMVCAEPAHAPHFMHAYRALFERCRSMVSAGGRACFDRVCGGGPSDVV